MQAVLCDLGLEKYIAKDGKAPESPDPPKLTTEVTRKWVDGNTKEQRQIELAISNAEIIHISGAMAVWEMWDQVTMVKESKEKLGGLTTCHAL